MKIVALHTDFRIYWPSRLKNLDTNLRKRGHSLNIIEIAGKGSPYSFINKKDDDNLNWTILYPNSRPEDLSGKQIQQLLFKKLNEINPDVIIAGAIAFPSGALAVRYGQLYKKKIIIFDDSKINTFKRNVFVNFIKRSIYNGVDAMLYPAKDWIETGEFWNFNTENLFFGVNVVDNIFWSKLRIREKQEHSYFIAVGRQIKKKNFDKIVEAYALYVKKIGIENAYFLYLIGEGPEHQHIDKIIKNLNLENKVMLFPFMEQEDLAFLYQNAQGLIINSTIEETWGLVINEAMSAGLPVFASNQCGATNILIKDGINGYRFDCNDVNGLSGLLTQFHLLPNIDKQKLSIEAKKIISDWDLERFSRGAIMAIEHVSKSKKRKTSLLDKFIISKWKGQYNPT